jgi:predicted ester cyclase
MATSVDATELCINSMHLMTIGSRADFDRVYAPGSINREAGDEPPATRTPGPVGFFATAEWLRSAFSDLKFEVHDAVASGDLVVLHVTMSGRHTGDFVTYKRDTDTIDAAMPATGKPFAITQTHWFRTHDGLITEHWANRDDLNMAKQAGWVPPTPGFLMRMAMAKRRANKATDVS